MIRLLSEYGGEFRINPDTDLSLDDHGHLHISVHTKPTNLHVSSCHPSSTKHPIPFSLTIQGQKICSHSDDLHIYTTNLTYPSSQGVIPTPHNQKKIPVTSILMPSYLPNTPMTPTPVTLLPHTILDSQNSNTSLEKDFHLLLSQS